MVKRPPAISAYEFAVVSGLRAKQLMRGCVPMVGTSQKLIMTAQLEVAAGLVAKMPDPPDPTEI
ncbi:MAG: DNA-directed RNA polymerase subunit omega [Acidobacteria bacterium]|nr:DNA-directed RNA polymerase subunit omega [Acidobacteriota bacterium]